MRCVKLGIEQNAPASRTNSIGELDILDGGHAVALDIEAPEIEEEGTAHGAAAGPEGRSLAARALMIVAMREILVLRREGGRGRRVVIGSEHGGHRMIGEGAPDPFR